MKLRKLAVVIALSAMGSFAITPLARAFDSDRDGVQDHKDLCPGSDVRRTVIVGTCNTGVPNTVDSVGCTIGDAVDDCLSLSLQQCIECVSNIGVDLHNSGDISAKQEKRFNKCAKVGC